MKASRQKEHEIANNSNGSSVFPKSYHHLVQLGMFLLHALPFAPKFPPKTVLPEFAKRNPFDSVKVGCNVIQRDYMSSVSFWRIMEGHQCLSYIQILFILVTVLRKFQKHDVRKILKTGTFESTWIHSSSSERAAVYNLKTNVWSKRLSILNCS